MTRHVLAGDLARVLLIASMALAPGLSGCRARPGNDPGGASKGTAARTSGESGDAGGAAWDLVYEQDFDGNIDVYRIAGGQAVPLRLTEDPGEDGLARWMPDGRSIVFTSNRTGNPQIWEMSPTGTGLRRLRRNKSGESQADPSPDGKRLAFLSDLDGPQRLVVMELDTGVVTDLVRHGKETIFGNPHWSPDGTRITFSSDWKIGHRVWVVDVAEGRAHRLKSRLGACEPRFTRDGRGVAYVSRGGDPTSRLVERDLATGEEKVLVDWPAFNYDLAWSPDGSEIAFASNITGEWVVYRMRLADGRAWRVTFGGGAARYPDYRPVAAAAAR